MKYGFSSLLTDGLSNPKVAKGKEKNYYSAIMHLAPAKLSGHNVCASASQGCIEACLNTAGRGRFDNVQKARLNRTKLFRLDRSIFLEILEKELDKLVNKAKQLNKQPACRLNGTSDIVWEKIAPHLFTNFPSIQYYDYTKHYKRCMSSYKLPENYHLTFSRSETNHQECKKVARSGKTNIAVVFRSKEFPKTYLGRPTYSMDDHDYRFLDPKGIGALYAKGKAKYDKTGFVID